MHNAECKEDYWTLHHSERERAPEVADAEIEDAARRRTHFGSAAWWRREPSGIDPLVALRSE
jgi:hypothetical protein